MGIFDAMNTSVAGLQSESFALQNISGNIANAQTTAYKGIGTNFEDLVPDSTTPARQVAGSVTAFARPTISSQGTVSAATVATFMAINGDGFFSVQKSTGNVDNVPVFSGDTLYTRRGDFQLNSNGNLVNGAGYFLMGVAVDPKTGNPLGSVPQVLQFQNNFVPAQATTAIQYAANLPSQPATAASGTAAPGSLTANGGLSPSDFISNPLPAGTPAIPFGNSSRTGGVAQNKLTSPVAITAATKLSGLANTDSVQTNFVAGDTIVVKDAAGVSRTITFNSGGGTTTTATGGTIDVTTGTVGDVLSAIDLITGTGTPSVVNPPPGPPAAGTITLNTGTAANLSIVATSSGWGSLGLPPTVNIARTGGGGIGTGNVTANDNTTFLKESISGGAVTAFDAAGTPINLQLRWAKTDSASLGAPHQDNWNLFYQTDPAAAGGQTEWVNAGTTFTFANGVLTAPPGSGITIPNVSVAGRSLGNINFNISAGSLTQFASSGGSATINNNTQNGFAAGQLQSVAVSDDGLVIGKFSNGQSIDLASIPLSHFNGTNYLKALDGGAYAVTDQSGPAIIGASGKISGSSLENSNTDIADEFTKLIVTQQAYSANTKVITTANSMVQDLLNVLR